MEIRRVVLAVTLAAAPALAAPPGDRLQQYLGLAKETLDHPITPRELEDALLSPAGVRDIALLFEKAIARGVVMEGRAVVPELGGEATLHRGALRLVEYEDKRHEVVRGMFAFAEDPRALLDFLTGSVEGQEVLRTSGGLHAHLFQMTTRPATAAQFEVLRQILARTAANYLKSWTVTPELQQEMIEKYEWRGRYVGFWHLHPPMRTTGGLSAGLEPSMEDMRIAVEKQQFLTLVFQPDGFDAYDLEPLARAGQADLSRARVIRHRAPEWRRRFAALP